MCSRSARDDDRRNKLLHLAKGLGSVRPTLSDKLWTGRHWVFQFVLPQPHRHKMLWDHNAQITTTPASHQVSGDRFDGDSERRFRLQVLSSTTLRAVQNFLPPRCTDNLETVIWRELPSIGLENGCFRSRAYWRLAEAYVPYQWLTTTQHLLINELCYL